MPDRPDPDARTGAAGDEPGAKARVGIGDEPDPERLAELDRRLRAAKRAQEPAPRQQGHVTQAQAAWRMVIDLVAGVGIGFGIGYGLDAIFGSAPVFLVLFILFGFAAGVRTMMRTAAELQADVDRKAHSAGDDGE